MKRDQFSRKREAFSSALSCAARYGVLLASIAGFLGGVVQAAPVTLQFEAVVGPPRLGSNGPIPALPPSWNISLLQGDTITGTFTFDPVDAPSNSSITRVFQPHEFTIQIKTQTLSTSQYGIEVYNNGGAVDDEGINPSDDIYVRCFGTPSCITANQVTPPSLTWAFHMHIGGYPSVLEGADVPADPAMWQQLTSEGSFLVSFNDTSERSFYSFLAKPTKFRAIPEPTTYMTALLGMTIVICARRFF